MNFKAVSSKRNRFHSDFKIAVASGVIPYRELSFLPKSTKHKLVNTPTDKFAELIGFKYSSYDCSTLDYPEKVNIIKQFAQSQSAIQIFTAALFIKTTVISILITYGSLYSKDFYVRKKVINAVDRVKHILGLNRVLKYFNISKPTYYNWAKQISFKCSTSPNALCFKSWATQLTQIEIHSLTKLFQDKIKLFWPLSSIWGYGFSNNIIQFSFPTFLKYIKLLNLNQHILRFKKSRKQGFVTTAPNQAWNADVTIYKLLNGMYVYIYFLIDHFSNLILSWKVSTVISSDIRKKTIEEAYLKYGNHHSQIFYSDIFPYN